MVEIRRARHSMQSGADSALLPPCAVASCQPVSGNSASCRQLASERSLSSVSHTAAALGGANERGFHRPPRCLLN